MDWMQTAVAVSTALACGLLLGAEREQGGGSLAAGARTFALFALSGAIGGLVGGPLLWVLGLGIASLVGISYVVDIRANRDEGIGMSSEVAALLTFGLGVVCTTDQLPELPFRGRLLLAAGMAAVTLGLLTFKELLHGAISHVTRSEIYAGTKLLLLLLVVVPLLPDEALGPYQALNPRELGLLVVLISGIGLGGYVAMKVLGTRRGLGLTGLLGGLVSSTAVTLSFAGRVRRQPSLVVPSALAIVLACATMFPRIVVELWVVAPGLVPHAALPAALAGGTGFAAAATLVFGSSREGRKSAAQVDVEVRNPFSVVSALKFTAVFAVVLVIANLAQERFGDSGTYLAAFVSGLTDVDAITLTLGQMHEAGQLNTEVAVRATALAALTNTLVKVGLAAVLGGLPLGLRVGGAMLAALAAGAIGFAF